MKKTDLNMVTHTNFRLGLLGLMLLCQVVFGHGGEGHATSGAGDPAATSGAASSGAREGAAGSIASASKCQQQAEQAGSGSQAEKAKKRNR